MSGLPYKNHLGPQLLNQKSCKLWRNGVNLSIAIDNNVGTLSVKIMPTAAKWILRKLSQQISFILYQAPFYHIQVKSWICTKQIFNESIRSQTFKKLPELFSVSSNFFEAFTNRWHNVFDNLRPRSHEMQEINQRSLNTHFTPWPA